MPEQLDKTIEDNAKGPKWAKGDSVEMEQHGLTDQIATDRYLASKKATQAKGLGVRLSRLVPSGGVSRSGLAIARPGQPMQALGVSCNQGFLLGAGPTLELGLTATRFGEGGKCLGVDDGNGWVEVGRAAGFARKVLLPSSIEVGGGPDIELPRSKAENIEKSGHGPFDAVAFRQALR
jgi:hypothetical protein